MTTAQTVETGNPASYRVEREQGCAVVVASGEIDLHTAPGLRRALAVAVTMSGRVVVDLTDVSFMDSTGLAVVLRARGRGGRPSVSLVHPPRMLRRVLHLTGLSDVLPVYRTRQNAIDQTDREHGM
jgi:anti-sigma B factor antagonist